MGFLDKFGSLSPNTKIAITWSLWGALTLTGYYFARLHIRENRQEALEARQRIFNQFDAQITEASIRQGFIKKNDRD